MGGFSLDFRRNNNQSTNSIYIERGQKVTFSYKSNALIFNKYSKKLLEKDPFIFEYENGFIIGSGTISYKSLSVIEGFKSLANDLINKKFEKDELFGHYSIIHYNKIRKKIIIYYDKGGYGAPFALNSFYISSSFLDCCDVAQDLHIDEEAVFEEVYTGCYFNGRTSFKEIVKMEGESHLNLNGIDISFIPINFQVTNLDYDSKNHAIESTLELLDKYLQRWKVQIKEFILDLGLSSGYDSRLLLALVEKNYNRSDFQLHSYWKKEKYFDNTIGEILAEILGKDLIQIPIKERNKLSNSEFELMIENAMIYYDGLFPVNHGWVREYRTALHREKILGKSRFGFSGLSGEQYRNDFNLLNKSFKTKWIIKNIILEERNDEVLRDSKFNSKGISIIKNSLIKGLDLKKSEKISRKEFQKFYCEMWVRGGPGIRNRIENSLSYFLSPFSEGIIQNQAYTLIDYLGIDGRFQAKMITKTNKKLASVISDYGFSFDKISIKYDLKGYLSVLLGRKNKIKLIRLLKYKSNSYLNSFEPHNRLIQSRLDSLKKYNFGFTIKSKKFGPDTVDRLIALSTLLKRYNNKIISK